MLLLSTSSDSSMGDSLGEKLFNVCCLVPMICIYKLVTLMEN